MNNKRSFFGGMAVGMIVILMVNFFAFGYRFGMIPQTGFTKEQWGKMTTKTDGIVRLLDKYYLNKIDKDKLLEGSYSGLVASVGDPYTTYFDKERYESFTIDTEGTYAGIGVVVGEDPVDHITTVVMPFEGSPGEKAGLLPKDKIIKVNGENVTKLDLTEVVKKMKGPEGTDVKVTVYRPSEKNTFDISITRAKIEIPTVSHKMIEDNIGYIKITGFDAVTYNQFVKALNDLETKNEKGLIIDLRNNPGGRLDIVSKIADTLLPEGIITYTIDKQGNKEVLRSKGDSSFNKPLVLLVNENSASASEILAGAVKDHGIGKLVGVTTFGKGLVQRIIEIGDGSAIKVTIAKYYTPSGNYINKKGIKPDFEVELPEKVKYKVSLTKEEDTQLQKALEIVKSEIF